MQVPDIRSSEGDERAFGALLRGRRVDRRLTQEQLAAATGLSTWSVNLERGGVRHPRPETVWLLADGLGLDGAELLPGQAKHQIDDGGSGPRRRLGNLVPAAAHVTEQYGNNRVEADHSRFKARLRPMRGLKRFGSAARIAAGHAFIQNLRRGHYELATDISPQLRLASAFSELALAM
jgi:transcriptional regulator with XRE-family HTH domain